MYTIIIDNYDSFTYNLYQYIGELGGNPEVFRNDELSLEQISKKNPDRIVISPGPGTPEDPTYFGVCRDVILQLGKSTPLLGVCLGHQGIIHSFGGTLTRAANIMHGKTSTITHNGQGLFASIPKSIQVMRYHSIIGQQENLPSCLVSTATTTDDNTLMGIAHTEYPISGIQFHPESITTTEGKTILKNFLTT